MQGFWGAFQKQRRAGAARAAGRPGVELGALETQMESSYHCGSQLAGAYASSATDMLGPATRQRSDRRGPVALRDRPTRRALAVASLKNCPSCIESLRSGGSHCHGRGSASRLQAPRHAPRGEPQLQQCAIVAACRAMQPTILATRAEVSPPSSIAVLAI